MSTIGYNTETKRENIANNKSEEQMTSPRRRPKRAALAPVPVNVGDPACTVGARVRFYREQRKLSQTSLAKDAGIAQTTLSGLENGTATNSIHLPRIAVALGVPLGALDPSLIILDRLEANAGREQPIDHDWLVQLLTAVLPSPWLSGISLVTARNLAEIVAGAARRPPDLQDSGEAKGRRDGLVVALKIVAESGQP